MKKSTLKGKPDPLAIMFDKEGTLDRLNARALGEKPMIPLKELDRIEKENGPIEAAKAAENAPGPRLDVLADLNDAMSSKNILSESNDDAFLTLARFLAESKDPFLNTDVSDNELKDASILLAVCTAKGRNFLQDAIVNLLRLRISKDRLSRKEGASAIVAFGSQRYEDKRAGIADMMDKMARKN